jgi:hypothetical protein
MISVKGGRFGLPGTALPQTHLSHISNQPERPGPVLDVRGPVNREFDPGVRLPDHSNNSNCTFGTAQLIDCKSRGKGGAFLGIPCGLQSGMF